ncbi:MAG: lipoyl synthase [Parachlamydiales bacterium]
MDRRFDSKPTVKNRLPMYADQEAQKGAAPMGRFPPWLHRKLPKGGGLWKTGQAIGERRLHTVCEEAKCPNLFECWSRKTATFLAMGKACTRACGFCDIETSLSPPPLEADEPDRIAESVQELGLKHVVITMVARDDLPDGGGAHLAKIMRRIKETSPTCTIEVLASDLGGSEAGLLSVLAEEPTVFNHNVETTRRLTPRVRHKATYDRSLALLSRVKQDGRYRFLKSGIMVGLGEEPHEVEETLRDLKSAGCDIVTIGQYLQPNRKKLSVKSFVTPEQFKAYETYGHSIGLSHVYSGPFIRSSYNADLVIHGRL